MYPYGRRNINKRKRTLPCDIPSFSDRTVYSVCIYAVCCGISRCRCRCQSSCLLWERRLHGAIRVLCRICWKISDGIREISLRIQSNNLSLNFFPFYLLKIFISSFNTLIMEEKIFTFKGKKYVEKVFDTPCDEPFRYMEEIKKAKQNKKK